MIKVNDLKKKVNKRENKTFSEIFLENNFKYQNAHNNTFEGAISANYGGFFTISCFLIDIFRGGMVP